MNRLKLACTLGKFGRLFVGLAAILIVVVHAPIATAEVTLLWDEETDGDLSNEMGSPTMLTIDQPGEYMLRTNTGPMVLSRREQPAPLSGLRLEALQRLDANSDRRLQRPEAAGNYAVHFHAFDLDGNDELDFDEIAHFDMGGDVHDLFDFVQADGINLVGIVVNSFDGGGDQNDVSVLVVMDLQSGRPREARGVEITSKSEQEMANHQAANPAVIHGPARAGDDIYETYQVWKAYRRNDPSNHFRIGEMQAESSAELVFVFE